MFITVLLAEMCRTDFAHFANLGVWLFTPFSQRSLVNFQVLSAAIPQRASPNTFCEESPAACFKIEQKIPLQRGFVEPSYVACYIPSARLDCFYSCVMVWWNVMHTVRYFTALVICNSLFQPYMNFKRSLKGFLYPNAQAEFAVMRSEELVRKQGYYSWCYSLSLASPLGFEGWNKAGP